MSQYYHVHTIQYFFFKLYLLFYSYSFVMKLISLLFFIAKMEITFSFRALVLVTPRITPVEEERGVMNSSKNYCKP